MCVCMNNTVFSVSAVNYIFALFVKRIALNSM